MKGQPKEEQPMTEPREFAKVSEVKEGDFLHFDGGFDCIDEGAKLEVKNSPGHGLWVECREGRHLLHGQLSGPFGGFDTETHYVGFYKE